MIVARAPLRISLGGGGTDLPSYYTQHGGFVLSAAIDKYVYIFLGRPFVDDLIRLRYSRSEQVQLVDDIQHDLVRPALKLLGVTKAIEVASLADAPDGTGLGSSGSYTVALLTALHELKHQRIPAGVLAEEACFVEMDMAGHPVGKQDHYLAAFGGITCLDIQRDGKVGVSPLNIPLSTVEKLRSHILLFFTGISRSSRDILQEQKDRTHDGDTATVDSLHYTKELGYRIKEALEDGDIEHFGLLLDEHWRNKKQRSSRISDSRIDRWYALAKGAGAIGGKIIGAGGGGFLMLCCPAQAKPALRSAMLSEGLREMPFDFDFRGAEAFLNV